MKRKTMIPVLIFAASLTVLVVVASIRGTLFQASLLSDGNGVTVGSGASFGANALIALGGTGSELLEFPIYTERTEAYRTALNAAGENKGFFFPSIYAFEKPGAGLITLAFRPDTPIIVEKNMRLSISYPSKVMRYAGERQVTASGATIVVDTTSQPNELSLEIMPSNGAVWNMAEEINPFLSLPMEVLDTPLLPNTGLQLKVTNAEITSFDNSVTAIPFNTAPVDILYFRPTNGETTRASLTTEVRVSNPATERGVLTMEMKDTAPEPTFIPDPVRKPAANTNNNSSVSAGTAQAFRMPLLTQDQTRVSPPLIREKSRETVYVYLSVTDPDGMDDIKTVEMDLSNFGLAPRIPLAMVSTGPKYSVYGGSFALPDSVISRDLPYEIPYMVMDGGSNVLQGALKFVVRPAASGTVSTTGTTAPSSLAPLGTSLLGTPLSTERSTTGTRPSAIDIETDLNGDGKVDNTDLSIYLFTFNLDRN
ncbi:hypothetical protein COW46_01965 [Candidatus Gracilibacteria bacterium CG17_big_fil_post_rev_8_21_14_2_50_48_13]|nr:MAG: hypothetical protein COW46_01965 [Candidatus Gracilibacteria bacterium CG17_big_fil_post_rev_8_21_14_2_50_48_13]